MDIEQRKKLIENQLVNAEEYKQSELHRRLARLGAGVAVINVGAATETEMKEKKMRIDDALNATKAAAMEGVVAGGGLTIAKAQVAIDTLTLQGEEQLGALIVRAALSEPLKHIARNAGAEPAEVWARIQSTSIDNYGYNAKSNTFEDLFVSGVIDPTKVVRSALQNAASIAAMVLTTEALVTSFEDEKDLLDPRIVM